MKSQIILNLGRREILTEHKRLISQKRIRKHFGGNIGKTNTKEKIRVKVLLQQAAKQAGGEVKEAPGIRRMDTSLMISNTYTSISNMICNKWSKRMLKKSQIL